MASTAMVGAIEKSAGGLPIKTAIACSNSARDTPTAINCARVWSSWGLGLGDIRSATPSRI